MSTKIFINLPVKDLDKSKEFFAKLGYTFKAQFTDEKAACLVISDSIFTMLITEAFFKTFLRKEMADAKKTTEVLLALSVDSKEQVDEMYNKAIAAGASEARKTEDHGFMFSRSFEDLDGHIWEILWMDPNYINKE